MKNRMNPHETQQKRLFESSQHYSKQWSNDDMKNQFSFSKNLIRAQVSQNSSLHHTEDEKNYLYEKYAELYDDLKVMGNDELIEILLEQLEQNEKQKNQVCMLKKKVDILQVECSGNKEELNKKREVIAALCNTQMKNLQIIQKLQGKLNKRDQYSRDTHYQKKYLQLSMYMNQYIRNINLAQEQFKKAYGFLKSQNSRLEKQLQLNSSECSRLHKKLQIQLQHQKNLKSEISQILANHSSLHKNLAMISEENEILRREIEVYQQNLRITDRLQAHIEHEKKQLSSDLDFIRDKISENQNISKDIIEKLEESSVNCDKVVREKEKIYSSLNKEKERIHEMEKQVNLLRKRNELLQSEVEKYKYQISQILREKEQLQEDLAEQNCEKQSIKRELYNLADKVRLMESTYRKQLQQNQKIKDELQKFWENKQKKQSSVISYSHSLYSIEQPQPLGETRTLNLKNIGSQSSITNCESDVKTMGKGCLKEVQEDNKQNLKNQSFDSLS